MMTGMVVMLAVPRASCSSFALGAKMRGIFPFSSVCHLVCDPREKGWVYEPDWQAWRRMQQIETPCQVVDPFDVLTFRVIISREWISSMWLCIPSIPNCRRSSNSDMLPRWVIHPERLNSVLKSGCELFHFTKRNVFWSQKVSGVDRTDEVCSMRLT